MKKISPGEINRFIYCPYQWYYERVYGRSYLQQLKKQRNEALGYTGSSPDHYARGQRFHQTYSARYKWKRRASILLGISLLLLMIGVVYHVLPFFMD